MSPLRRALVTWLPLVAWMAAIYWLSDQPDLPHAPAALLDTVLKKGLHAAGYGVLAILWLRALRDAGVPSPAWWAFGLTIAYAVSDEWHQTHVPGRTGRPVDVAVDAAGAAVALWWACRLQRRRRLALPDSSAANRR